MNEQLIALSVLGLILLAMVLMIGVAIASGRKNTDQKRHLAQTLGFTPLEAPDRAVEDRIIALHERGYHQKIQVRNLYRLNRPDCTLYQCNIWDVGGQDHDLITEAAIAIIAPGLELPRFSLIPKVNAVGWAADMANQFITKLVGQRAQVITFEDRPSFDKRYFVAGDDELAVRRCLTGPVLAALTQTQIEGLTVEAEGDTLVLAEMNVGAKRGDVLEKLRSRRDLALLLFERLQAGF